MFLQDSKRDGRMEPKKQAKVKPMSAADEKLIDNAITMANAIEIQRLDSVNSPDSDSASGSESPRLISKLKASLKRSPKQERKRTFSDSLNHDLSDDVPPEAQEAYNLLVVHGSVKESSKTKQHDSSFGSRESPRSSIGSGGLNFAYADSSSSSPSRTPDRASPPKPLSRASSERASASPPNLARINSVETTPDRKVDPKPVPKPRPEVLPKRSEIPVPKPRPEIVQRVEPTPRPPPPAIPAKDTSKLIQDEDTTKQAFVNPLVINEEDWNNSEQHWTSENTSKVQIVRSDGPNQISRYGEVLDQDKSPDEKGKPFFEDELAEPSPREIMSKLARESRLRRSLDHQRVGAAEGEAPAPNRNLREPQGIPGKSYTAPNGEEEEEVDTNPLRMLRGGVIPVRGGRAGSGTNSTKPTLRHPKLHFNNQSLQHSVSVDTGSERILSEADAELEQEDDATTPPPKLPPRSISVCDSTVNPLPLPPRNPLRPSSLYQKPRERKYPLLLDDDDDSGSQTSQSHAGDHVNDKASSKIDKASSEIDKASSDGESPIKHLPDPVVTACKALHDTDSSSYSDLPLAPLPPVVQEDNEMDDNVFEISDSPRVSKQLNLSSEGGSSGASTFPRGFKLFGLKNVTCNLEQLGFYNHQDPFWVKTVTFSDEQRCYSDRSTSTDAEASPLMLANYKSSDGVSYEDLLDFAIDR